MPQLISAPEGPQRVRPAPGCPGILVAHLGSAPRPYVYVGRAMKGIPASPLGIPFRPSEVDDAIGRFRGWLRDAYRADLAGRATLAQAAAAAELRRLADIFREEGRLTLACWCAPDDCHADVIAEAVVGIVAATPVEILIPGLQAGPLRAGDTWTGDTWADTVPACAHYDRELAEEGLPWVVSRHGRVLRVSASLRQARSDLAPFSKKADADSRAGARRQQTAA